MERYKENKLTLPEKQFPYTRIKIWKIRSDKYV